MFSITIDDEPVAVPFQAQRVLACLAVGEPKQPRSTVAGQLWGAVPETRAQATLRNTLWRIRQVSGAIVTSTREALELSPSMLVDLKYAKRIARRLQRGDQTADDEERAVSLLDHDLLPSWDEDWLTIERERVRQLRIHALEGLSASLLRNSQFSLAIQAALAAVSAEPLRESAQTALIRAHLCEGNPFEAIRQFDAYSRLLFDELGLEPSPHLHGLIRPVAGKRSSTSRPQ
jgi:DNA-binding SARP family transcriptional activator